MSKSRTETWFLYSLFSCMMYPRIWHKLSGQAIFHPYNISEMSSYHHWQVLTFTTTVGCRFESHYLLNFLFIFKPRQIFCNCIYINSTLQWSVSNECKSKNVYIRAICTPNKCLDASTCLTHILLSGATFQRMFYTLDSFDVQIIKQSYVRLIQLSAGVKTQV